MKHIAVVGAGISGVTTAYSLLQRGYQVTVLDRNRYAAMMTSFANGGQLSASNAEVWTQFSTVLKGIRWMFKRDAPLLINPRPDWHKYSWMAEFVGNIPNYESNTIESTRLAIAARQHLFDWASRENIDFDHEARGIMHICVDKHGFEHGQRVNELLARGGLERHSVTPDEMRAIEPALSGDLYGGFYTESDSTGDIHKYTRGLAQACQRKGGKFLFDVRVQKLSSENGKVQITYYADVDYTVECDTFDGVVI
ncbi:MAG: FAD-dependent oxidoreductase [Granulosicoccus sp.]|nr:FAD-dependent oxidoreductase [Granulosicoccus sp.]